MTQPFVQSYLFFGGRCEEALEFYQSTLGAQVGMLMRHRDSPEPAEPGRLPPGFEDKVLHTSFRIGSTEIMASDGCGEGGDFKGFSLSLAVEGEAEARRCFDALAVSGRIIMPLDKTFWAPCFGMLMDKFGIHWMISVAACGPESPEHA